jgi:hypothetical protein
MPQFYTFGVKSIIKNKKFLNYIKGYKRDPASNDNELSERSDAWPPTLGISANMFLGFSATFSVDKSIPFHTTIQRGQQSQFRTDDKNQNMTRKRKSVSPICPRDAQRTDLH